MIDTVRLSLPIAMHDQKRMMDLGFSPVCGHHGRSCQHPARWKLNPLNVAAKLPRLTWNRASNGLDYLSAALSIPKLLFGSNVEMVENQDEIDRALNMTSRHISEAASISFDANASNVTRVDFSHNWRLTPIAVCDYLRILGSASLPRMRQDRIGEGTIRFSNRSQAVEFYDKLPEVISRLRQGKATNEEVTACVGLLRFEVRFLNYRACDELALKLGLPNRRAGTLLKLSTAVVVMNNTLNELGLDKSSESGDVRLDRLLQPYGPTRALKLVGFLLARDRYGANNLIPLGICKRSTFHKMRREIELAGVWLNSGGTQSLPPLRLIQPSKRARAA